MRDYDGDMSYFQNQLAKKDITKEMLDMEQFDGLTAQELQNIVNSVQVKKEV